MTQARSQLPPDPLVDWVHRVNELAAQVERWSRARSWSVDRSNRIMTDAAMGRTYDVPVLRIWSPLGELHLEPVARNVIGGAGRVDLSAWPSLNHVKLLWIDGAIRVVTSIRDILDADWDEQTFERIASELLSQP